MKLRVLNSLWRFTLPHPSGKPAMRDFSHLSALSPDIDEGSCLSPLARHYLRVDRVRNMASVFAGENEQSAPVHSDAHRIAVSQEGKNNPVMALSCISKGMDADRAIRLLSDSPRALSQFTIRKMQVVCAGWELMDAKSQNMTAFSSSMASNDANGYVASLNAAGKALEKYVEPLTLREVVALAAQTSVTKFI